MGEFVEHPRETLEYHDFLRGKVEAARSSIHANRGRPDEEVEADFAICRAALARSADEA